MKFMKTSQLKRSAAFPGISAMLLVCFGLLTPSRAEADLYTYDFSGTLTSPFDGISTVSGWFTLDTTTDAETAWDLTLAPLDLEVTRSPGAGLTNQSDTSGNAVLELTFDYPSGNPYAPNYITLGFDARSISLANLPPIDINPVSIAAGCSTPCYYTSGVYDNQNGVWSGFTEATVVPTPEPSGFALLLTILASVLFVMRKLLSRNQFNV
jgi:hypothetical protein